MTKLTSNRREFIVRMTSVSAVLSAGSVITACGGVAADDAVDFAYGVASGDPLSDRVILWTHAKYTGKNTNVALTYEVATDNIFSATSVVASGFVIATASTNFTAKVDATGLQAGKTYYYRFKAGSTVSPVGKTRTLPDSTATEVKLAVFSCANYPEGFFHVYGLASKSDAQYALHLGDYLYEYPDGTYPTAATGFRKHQPVTEIYSLDDYRTRHAQYKSDPDLKVLHASMPMISVWDDHEVANDTYKDGAENHDPSKEGSFAARKAVAIQAYHEWMPIRTGSDLNIIYRSFDFGSVLSLHMLDTRLIGRDKQVAFAELLNPSTAASAQATLYSPTRELMGTTQSTWLTEKIKSSAATWQVLGQQVVMARMEFPVSVLSALNPDTLTSADALTKGLAAVTDYVTAKNTPAGSRTATQVGLMNTTLNPKLGYNLDAWDGYPLAREKLLAAVLAANKKLVVLSGDTHNAWHTQLTLAGFLSASQAGVKVGEEFATPSVTSVGLESYFSTLPSANVKSIYESVVDDLKWMDPSRRGYLKMTFTKTQAKGEWIFVNSVKSTSYTVETPATAETRTYSI
ncbi:MAG: alkaline phosphatase [Betaproteobacteria bacterium]|nr:alkaline phosphatase [Betaproteobacteria bacterium]